MILKFNKFYHIKNNRKNIIWFYKIVDLILVILVINKVEVVIIVIINKIKLLMFILLIKMKRF